MKRDKIKQRSADIPADFFEEMPGVYVKGISELMIDGKCRLIEYLPDRITFDIFYRGMLLIIEGSQLTMRCAGVDAREITGRISSVKYASKGENNV